MCMQQVSTNYSNVLKKLEHICNMGGHLFQHLTKLLVALGNI
jgi:hypothetical protein